MAKVLNHGNRKEKGLTLIEVVIALSVIVTVSLATVSIVVFSSTSLEATARKNFFQHEINTFADLYLSYEGENYKTAMNRYTGADVVDGTDHTFYYDASYHYAVEASSAYYAVLDFEEGTLRLGAYKKDGTPILTRDVKR